MVDWSLRTTPFWNSWSRLLALFSIRVREFLRGSQWFRWFQSINFVFSGLSIRKLWAAWGGYRYERSVDRDVFLQSIRLLASKGNRVRGGHPREAAFSSACRRWRFPFVACWAIVTGEDEDSIFFEFELLSFCAGGQYYHRYLWPCRESAYTLVETEFFVGFKILVGTGRLWGQ